MGLPEGPQTKTQRSAHLDFLPTTRRDEPLALRTFPPLLVLLAAHESTIWISANRDQRKDTTRKPVADLIMDTFVLHFRRTAQEVILARDVAEIYSDILAATVTSIMRKASDPSNEGVSTHQNQAGAGSSATPIAQTKKMAAKYDGALTRSPDFTRHSLYSGSTRRETT